MNARNIRSVSGVLFALSTGLVVGVALSVWANTTRLPYSQRPQAAYAAPAALALGTSETAKPPAVNVPQDVSTPVLPDFTASIYWDGAFTCPDPVLMLVSNYVQHSPCLSHVNYDLHIVNNNGDSRDFSTGMVHGGAIARCQVGREIPFDWLQALPLTLTVDYGNQVPESNENNNTATLNVPPPNPTACSTVTATPTQLPTFTSTSTCTVTPTARPDLVGSMSWSSTLCPTPVLKLRTILQNLYCPESGPSHMRLSNNAGSYMDFGMSSLYGYQAYEELDCPVGPCLPTVWLSSFPLTLTVDVFNEVYEGPDGEGNNISQFSDQPPCGGLTPTPSLTSTITPTPSATPPPNCPDLMARVYWVEMCYYPRYLQLTTYQLNPNASPVPPTTMRLQNRNGDHQDIPVPALDPQNNWTYTFACGCTITFAYPMTLTVDYFNQVVECNENNNTAIMSNEPPTRTPCPTFTYTPTFTRTRTSTASPTPSLAATNTPTLSVTATNTPTSYTSTASPTPSLTTTNTSTPCTTTFSDVHPSDYFYEPVRYLHCHGVISGYSDGTFKPYNLTTRGQLAKIVVLAMGWPLYTPPTPTFQDVPTTHTFFQYIETTYSHGIISGYSCGTGCLEFRPNNSATRGQICKIVYLAVTAP